MEASIGAVSKIDAKPTLTRVSREMAIDRLDYRLVPGGRSDAGPTDYQKLPDYSDNET